MTPADHGAARTRTVTSAAPPRAGRGDDPGDCAVLVIGSGLAGMMAALAAHEQGARVTLACTGALGADGDSAIASGGLAVAANTAAGDDPDRHREDTIRSGAGLVTPAVATAVTAEAPALLERLVGYGAGFARDQNGGYAFKPIPGHRFPRSVRCDGGGTATLMTPLVDAIRATDIRVVDHVFVRELIRANGTDGGPVIGAAALREADGSSVTLSARAVVLAAGGLGQLFVLTSNQPKIFGSGYALALRAGCSVTDLEFIQFTPTALVYPTFASGMSPGGALMAQPGVALRNTEGERFMRRYDPENGECTTRDVLARAIHREVSEGRGTRHGGVYLDLSGTTRTAISDISGRFLRAMDAGGFDPFEDKAEVAPEAHFCMGGVAVNAQCATGVPGLYAAGEVASGLHGANRLNSNALTEAAVTGRTAGIQAARHAASTTTSSTESRQASTPTPWHDDAGTPDDPSTADAVRRRIKELMARGAGVERHADSLGEVLDELRGLAGIIDRHEHACAAPDRQAWISVGQMRLTAEAVASAALARNESRGSHFRRDHPRPRPELCAHNLLRWHPDSGLSMQTVPAGEVPRIVSETSGRRPADVGASRTRGER